MTIGSMPLQVLLGWQHKQPPEFLTMPRSKPSRRTPEPNRDQSRQVSQRATPGILEQRGLSASGTLPQVRLKSTSFHPFLYRRMVASADASAQPGDLVEVIDRDGQRFGYGLYNPRSEIVVRLLSYDEAPPDEAFWQTRLERAVQLRRELLRLDETTNAYRVVHAEGDGLTGLVVDRFGDVLSAEIFSLGMYQRAEALLARLSAFCGTRHTIISVDAQVHGQEGFLAESVASGGAPRQATITEHGTRFRVNFGDGHKTGYFCDQRDNRRQLAEFCRGKTVLDVCCYTGGFAVQAKRLGQAAEVTAVDLDEKAIALARDNAQLNQAKIDFIHADAFGYMRDMIANRRQYDVVILDPPKLIRSRRELEEGTRKHFDFNRLAFQLVRPGGLLLSCSCSGLLSEAEFLRLLYAAARQAAPRTEELAARRSLKPARSVQLLAKTGASPDHPVAANCPETEYLRAAWMRVE
jgi:23S rRNA (cytosine1962-C5)-methyltransferase